MLMNEVVQNERHMQKGNHHRNDHQSFTLKSIFVFDYHIKFCRLLVQMNCTVIFKKMVIYWHMVRLHRQMASWQLFMKTKNKKAKMGARMRVMIEHESVLYEGNFHVSFSPWQQNIISLKARRTDPCSFQVSWPRRATDMTLLEGHRHDKKLTYRQFAHLMMFMEIKSPIIILQNLSGIRLKISVFMACGRFAKAVAFTMIFVVTFTMTFVAVGVVVICDCYNNNNNNNNKY